MNLIQVGEFINNTCKSEILTDYELKIILSILGTAVQLRYMLEEIILNDDYSNICSSLSEIHRLGFDKLSILSITNTCVVAKRYIYNEYTKRRSS